MEDTEQVVQDTEATNTPTTLSFSRQVYDIAKSQMLEHPEERVTQESVASALEIGERSLRRRLQKEGETFTGIRDEALKEAASEAISGGGITLAELSKQLGFSHQSAFTRAFRRWYGMKPSEYRASLSPLTDQPVTEP